MAVSGQTEFKQLETQNDKELYNHSTKENLGTTSNTFNTLEGVPNCDRNSIPAKEKVENSTECQRNIDSEHNLQNSKDTFVTNDTGSYKRTLRSQSKAEKENENFNPDRLMKKLGFDPVHHLAHQSNAVQEAGLKMNGTVVKGTDGLFVDKGSDSGMCINKTLEDVKDITSDVKSEDNSGSRSSTPASCDDMDFLELGPQTKRIKEQKIIVENFKAELRSEEAKLVFLRKLLESQIQKKNGQNTKPSFKDGNKVLLPSFQMKQTKNPPYGSVTTANHNSHIQIAPKIVLPPRTVTSGPNVPKVVPSIVSVAGKPPLAPSTSYTGDPNAGRGKYAIPHSVGNSQNIAPTTSTSHQSVQQKYYIQVGSQLLPATGPPPANRPVYTIQSYNSSTTAVTTTGVNMSPSNASSISKQPATNSQESKQSAAKAALRRQLEQTLLQIPPPKPPPADWSAIPNVNSMDFMMLVGLDEIVDDLLAAEGKPTMVQALAEMIPSNPRVCAQCNVDFSPSWRVKPDSSAESYLCEKCSTMNVKKELKAEHTSRLKAAFLRALKQEQEIEEKIKAGEDVHIGLPPVTEKPEAAPQGTAIHHPQHVHTVHQPYKHHTQGQSVDHHHPVIHHRHHQVVQHYPRHTPLVHQLHQQHLQQQQMEIETTIRRGGGSSSSSSSSGRWHPYIPSHHHGGHVHGSSRHSQRSYIPNSEGRHEYYVVHHPQHSNIRWTR